MTTFNILNLSNFQSYSTRLAMNQTKMPQRLLSLRIFAAFMVFASLPVSAQQPTPDPEPTVVVGSDVSLASIAKAEWIQGEAPKAFEPGKVYIFECWSTWCGPCIAMIPHMNELHKKYYDKGLRVYGISVYEDDVEKVKKFVKKKGDGMSYPVAFTGKEGAFEMEVFRAAGAKAIPHAFVVRNGKLLASTQASRLTEPLIETLLSGDEGAKKVSAVILSAETQKGKTDKLYRDFHKARWNKDADKMTAHLNELKAIDPGHYEILTLELWVLIVRKEWPAAVTALNEMPISEAQKSFVGISGLRVAAHQYDWPADFVKALTKAYTGYVMLSEVPIGPNHFACLSILQWRTGDKENAVITAAKGVEAAKTQPRGSEAMTKAFVRFAKSVNEGTMPKFADLAKWQRESKNETTDMK